MSPEIQATIDRLQAEIDSLKNTATFPLETEAAIRDRLDLSDGVQKVIVSTKDVDSEDQAVDEASSGTYNVLKEPDGFLEVTISGTIYYIPYYG